MGVDTFSDQETDHQKAHPEASPLLPKLPNCKNRKNSANCSAIPQCFEGQDLIPSMLPLLRDPCIFTNQTFSRNLELDAHLGVLLYSSPGLVRTEGNKQMIPSLSPSLLSLSLFSSHFLALFPHRTKSFLNSTGSDSSQAAFLRR